MNKPKNDSNLRSYHPKTRAEKLVVGTRGALKVHLTTSLDHGQIYRVWAKMYRVDELPTWGPDALLRATNSEVERRKMWNALTSAVPGSQERKNILMEIKTHQAIVDASLALCRKALNDRAPASMKDVRAAAAKDAAENSEFGRVLARVKGQKNAS